MAVATDAIRSLVWEDKAERFCAVYDEGLRRYRFYDRHGEVTDERLVYEPIVGLLATDLWGAPDETPERQEGHAIVVGHRVFVLTKAGQWVIEEKRQNRRYLAELRYMAAIARELVRLYDRRTAECES